MTWWDRTAVEALIRDLVIDELRRLRPTQALPLSHGEAGAVQLDSLERLQIADRLAVFFQMREVGLEDNLLATSTLTEWIDIVSTSLTHHDQTVAFRTSGSTGEPRTLVHEMVRLEREATFWADQLKDARVIVTLVPRHHIYGFIFTLLLPRALGLEVIDGRGRLPSRLARDLPAGALLIGYPDLWRLIAADAQPFATGTWGITSTAPCPDSLASALVPAHIERLIQIYGASEIAGIGWRDAPNTPYRLLPHWRRGADDELIDSASDCGQETGFRGVPPDHLEWLDAHHFYLCGRRDQAVAIAGINVYPERIARHLETLPEVLAAAVRPMRAHEGARLKAFIVPTDLTADRNRLLATITTFTERTLAPMERPRAFTVGEHWPRGTLGKALDWEIDITTSGDSDV
jgi:4-coumarate--CoA ligase (photoactive yellow protein activation family)